MLIKRDYIPMDGLHKGRDDQKLLKDLSGDERNSGMYSVPDLDN